MRSRVYTIRINGEVWKYRLHSREQFNKLYQELANPGSTAAVTDTATRRMDFADDSLSFRVAFHELFHCYCRYLYLESSNISVADFEEIVCDLLGERVLLMVDQANQIYNRLTGVKDDKKRVSGLPRSGVQEDARDHQG